MQVLQRQWDPTFSQHSYGFRPERSAHQAVAQAQQYIVAGYGWVVDLDLEKFFDRVNHDKLMRQIANRVEDKRLLKLIRAFLNAGVMDRDMECKYYVSSRRSAARRRYWGKTAGTWTLNSRSIPGARKPDRGRTPDAQPHASGDGEQQVDQMQLKLASS